MAKVTYTDRAYDDIDRIIEFNNRRNLSTTYSKKFLKDLRARVAKLSKQPFSGVKTNDPQILLIIWDNFYIYYQPLDKSIEITAVYHQKEILGR